MITELFLSLDVLMVDDNFVLGPEHSDISEHYKFGDEG